MSRIAAAALIACGLLLSAPARGQQTELETALSADTAASGIASDSSALGGLRPYSLYRPQIDYGSASMRDPVDAIVNRGMSILSLGHQEHSLEEIRWEAGWNSVRDALTHPRRAVRRWGNTWAWLRKETLPDEGRVWMWAWAPNYGGHVLAGGLTYRFLAEWYDAHGVPAPRVVAAANSWGMMVLNEVLEQQSATGGHASTVADLYIFDPLGILVFSFDAPARFLSERLQAADWSGLALVTFPSSRVVTGSQNMSYKIPIPLFERAQVLMMIGQGAAMGGRLRLANGYHIAGAIGFQGDRRVTDPQTGIERIEAEYGGAVYLDRNNSLLFSAGLSPRHYHRVQVTVFPGLLPGVLRAAGFTVNVTERGHWSAGVSLRRTGGVGLGFAGH